MKFTPKTENEVQSDGRLPKGEYDFEIVESSDEVSKKGNEMIKLKVQVYDDEGHGRILFDYLLEEISYKLRHAAYACKLGDNYEAGTLAAADFAGRAGRCKVGIQKDKTGEYPDKNVIQDYIVGVEEIATANAAQARKAPAPVLDDLIPF